MRREGLVCRLIPLVFTAACASVQHADYEALARGATPSLEDVFSIPGIHGASPSSDSVSADGEWLVVRWRGVQRDGDGRLEWSPNLGPFLLSTSSRAVELDASRSLPRLLEQCERDEHARGGSRRVVTELEGWKPGEPERLAWSERGHRLALAWEGAILLLDFEDELRLRRTVLFVDEPEESEPSAPAPEVTPGEQDSIAPPSNELPKRLGKLRGLEFDRDDTALVARTADEIFVFPLDGTRELPLELSDAEWPTRELAGDLEDVQWNEARTLFFSGTKALGEIERAADDGSLVKTSANVFDAATGAPVALASLPAKDALESARLSPDGRFVFACDVDHSAEPAATLVPDYLSERVTTREGRKLLADDPWPPRKLAVWSTADGARHELALPGESAYSFAFLGWAPQATPDAPARCALRRITSDYRTAETWVWHEGELACVLTERDERWIGGPGGGARWSRDGRKLTLNSECVPTSTTPGRSQLFELDVTTRALRQLTNVEGEVASFVIADDGTLVFSASRADPARRELGVVDATSGVTRWLDTPDGMKQGLRIGDLGEIVCFEHEALGVPGELHALPLTPGATSRRLTSTTPAEYDAQRWIRPVKLALTHEDGTRVHSHVYLPRATSLARPDRARACVVFIHGAGYLQNVADSMTEYAVNLMFHSRLAELGYVVLDVDYRGSAGYGAKFRGDVQFKLGELELDDIALAVDELARRGVIDAERVGCYGGSYGGFLTLMALFTEGERWVCGAALRSVTDWRTYHPGYTQPRLGRPSTHADAYARSSPIDHAAKLRDPLLILHGMVDTNVFAQDSIRLIEKLIDLGLPFDAMLYPSQGHAFDDGAHWIDEYRRIERFFFEHLGAP